ncbi:multiple sugar transport system permease protein [Actinoalloteichus hoggarensis]|uniref:Lactose transport system permease protein LacF n=1 Tax=Actinoalloteichus hoggarensis TaxID=1470176 RepID=A0A221W7K1_9PSEU|nr:sugar ABC transporter permease [Actinoalloteichus hoggarensis]ASO21960.1 Lactose transport system permease protein LacF [Actinoalloteichus hoggarensis]MBB5923960.1 multiple sugar transport system permease protein [Actinoalloteichus hoggarensis]
MVAQQVNEVASPQPGGTRPGRARKGPKNKEQTGIAYLFLSPWIAGAVLLTIGPMVASLYLSFTNYNLFTAPEWVGLDNYIRLFTQDDRFMSSVGVTFQYVFLSAPLKLAAALGVALLLNRPRKGQGFYRSAFYAPSLLGASVGIALVWRSLFTDDGAVDSLLRSVGIDTGGWINQPDYAMYVIVILAVWQFGAPMVIFLAGLKQIPQDLYDAAAVDGASTWKTFTSVTLPMLSPVIFFNLVMEIIQSFQSFTGAFVVSNGQGGPADSTLFYTLYLYQRGFQDFQMGYASAMAWLLLLTIALFTGLVFKTSGRWVFYAGEDK